MITTEYEYQRGEACAGSEESIIRARGALNVMKRVIYESTARWGRAELETRVREHVIKRPP